MDIGKNPGGPAGQWYLLVHAPAAKPASEYAASVVPALLAPSGRETRKIAQKTAIRRMVIIIPSSLWLGLFDGENAFALSEQRPATSATLPTGIGGVTFYVFDWTSCSCRAGKHQVDKLRTLVQKIRTGVRHVAFTVRGISSVRAPNRRTTTFIPKAGVDTF